MKKILFGLLAFCVVMSCKKEHKTVPPTNTLQKVTFKVGFAQSTGIISTNSTHPLATNSLAVSSTPDTSLTNHINTIYYMIFDSVGNLFQNVTQAKTDTAFGHCTQSLHPGKYTVAIAGCSGMTLNPGTLNTQNISGGFAFDTFFQRMQITVGASSLNQSFSLNRISSKIVVNINDALPAGAGYASLAVYGVSNVYYVGTDKLGPAVNQYFNAAIPSGSGGKTNYQISGLFLYLAPFGADVSVAQNSDNSTVYGEKIISNITGAPNTVTKLSGNLFGGVGLGGSSGFQVGVDSTWKTPINITFP